MASKDEKLDAFKAYDFDGNEEWKAHLRNIELPAAASAAALQKVKAKWYKKVVDPDFDPAWMNINTAVPAPSQTPPHQQQSTRNDASSRPSSASTSRRQPAAGRQPVNLQLNLALLQAAILVLTLLYLQPLAPGLSYWAYNRLTFTLLVSQAVKLYTAHGLPAGFNFAALKAWLQRAAGTTDAHYFLLAVSATLSPPVTLLLAPYVVLALYSLGYFISDQFSQHTLWQKYGLRVYRALVMKQQQALQFNAQSEIALGFQLLAGLLFPGRKPLLTLTVWQMLRWRYWSSDAAVYHRQVWGALDQLTVRVRQHLLILQKAVEFGQRWFLQQQPVSRS